MSAFDKDASYLNVLAASTHPHRPLRPGKGKGKGTTGLRHPLRKKRSPRSPLGNTLPSLIGDRYQPYERTSTDEKQNTAARLYALHADRTTRKSPSLLSEHVHSSSRFVRVYLDAHAYMSAAAGTSAAGTRAIPAPSAAVLTKLEMFTPEDSTWDFHDMKIGDDGLLMLLGVFKLNPNLRFLNLSNCTVGDRGVAGLVATVSRYSPQLSILDLSNNPVSEVRALKALVEVHPNLETIHLYFTLVGTAGQNLLTQKLESNRKNESLSNQLALTFSPTGKLELTFQGKRVSEEMLEALSSGKHGEKKIDADGLKTTLQGGDAKPHNILNSQALPGKQKNGEALFASRTSRLLQSVDAQGTELSAWNSAGGEYVPGSKPFVRSLEGLSPSSSKGNWQEIDAKYNSKYSGRNNGGRLEGDDRASWRAGAAVENTSVYPSFPSPPQHGRSSNVPERHPAHPSWGGHAGGIDSHRDPNYLFYSTNPNPSGAPRDAKTHPANQGHWIPAANGQPGRWEGNAQSGYREGQEHSMHGVWGGDGGGQGSNHGAAGAGWGTGRERGAVDSNGNPVWSKNTGGESTHDNTIFQPFVPPNKASPHHGSRHGKAASPKGKTKTIKAKRRSLKKGGGSRESLALSKEEEVIEDSPEIERDPTETREKRAERVQLLQGSIRKLGKRLHDPETKILEIYQKLIEKEPSAYPVPKLSSWELLFVQAGGIFYASVWKHPDLLKTLAYRLLEDEKPAQALEIVTKAIELQTKDTQSNSTDWLELGYIKALALSRQRLFHEAWTTTEILLNSADLLEASEVASATASATQSEAEGAVGDDEKLRKVPMHTKIFKTPKSAIPLQIKARLLGLAGMLKKDSFSRAASTFAATRANKKSKGASNQGSMDEEEATVRMDLATDSARFYQLAYDASVEEGKERYAKQQMLAVTSPRGKRGGKAKGLLMSSAADSVDQSGFGSEDLLWLVNAAYMLKLAAGSAGKVVDDVWSSTPLTQDYERQSITLARQAVRRAKRRLKGHGDEDSDTDRGTDIELGMVPKVEMPEIAPQQQIMLFRVMGEGMLLLGRQHREASLEWYQLAVTPPVHSLLSSDSTKESEANAHAAAVLAAGSHIPESLSDAQRNLRVIVEDARRSHGGWIRTDADHVSEILSLFAQQGVVVLFCGHALDKPIWEVQTREDSDEVLVLPKGKGKSVYSSRSASPVALADTSTPTTNVHERFPANDYLFENRVSLAIEHVLADVQPSVGYCCIRSGSDILFAERLLARASQLHVVVPHDLSEFLTRWVDYGDHDLAQWRIRAQNVLNGAQFVHYITNERNCQGSLLLEYSMSLMRGMALLEAKTLGQANPVMVGVVDGRGRWWSQEVQQATLREKGIEHLEDMSAYKAAHAKAMLFAAQNNIPAVGEGGDVMHSLTYRVVEAWGAARRPTRLIDLAQCREARLPFSMAEADLPSTASPTSAQSPREQKDWVQQYSLDAVNLAKKESTTEPLPRRTCCILHAAFTSEDLAECAIPHFIQTVSDLVTKCIADVLKPNDEGCLLHITPLFLDQRLVMFFDDSPRGVVSCARFAMFLLKMVEAFDWAANFLPATTSLCIGLHYAPVFYGSHPFLKNQYFFGGPVHHAYHIQAAANGSTVLASQQFAAALADSEYSPFTEEIDYTVDYNHKPMNPVQRLQALAHASSDQTEADEKYEATLITSELLGARMLIETHQATEIYRIFNKADEVVVAAAPPKPPSRGGPRRFSMVSTKSGVEEDAEGLSVGTRAVQGLLARSAHVARSAKGIRHASAKEATILMKLFLAFDFENQKAETAVLNQAADAKSGSRRSHARNSSYASLSGTTDDSEDPFDFNLLPSFDRLRTSSALGVEEWNWRNIDLMQALIERLLALDRPHHASLVTQRALAICAKFSDRRTQELEAIRTADTSGSESDSNLTQVAMRRLAMSKVSDTLTQNSFSFADVTLLMFLRIKSLVAGRNYRKAVALMDGLKVRLEHMEAQATAARASLQPVSEHGDKGLLEVLSVLVTHHKAQVNADRIEGHLSPELLAKIYQLDAFLARHSYLQLLEVPSKDPLPRLQVAIGSAEQYEKAYEARSTSHYAVRAATMHLLASNDAQSVVRQQNKDRNQSISIPDGQHLTTDARVRLLDQARAVASKAMEASLQVQTHAKVGAAKYAELAVQDAEKELEEIKPLLAQAGVQLGADGGALLLQQHLVDQGHHSRTVDIVEEENEGDETDEEEKKDAKAREGDREGAESAMSETTKDLLERADQELGEGETKQEEKEEDQFSERDDLNEPQKSDALQPMLVTRYGYRSPAKVRANKLRLRLFWIYTSLAEANLIRSDFEMAHKWYTFALHKSTLASLPDRMTVLNSAFTNCQLVSATLNEEFFSGLGLFRSHGAVVMFVGCQLDSLANLTPGQEVVSFDRDLPPPPDVISDPNSRFAIEEVEARGKYEIGKALAKISPAVGFCMCLTDSDINFCELMLSMSASVNICLPFDLDTFYKYTTRQFSGCYPESRWRSRCEIVFSHPNTQIHYISTELFSFGVSPNAHKAVNERDLKRQKTPAKAGVLAGVMNAMKKTTQLPSKHSYKPFVDPQLHGQMAFGTGADRNTILFAYTRRVMKGMAVMAAHSLDSPLPDLLVMTNRFQINPQKLKFAPPTGMPPPAEVTIQEPMETGEGKGKTGTFGGSAEEAAASSWEWGELQMGAAQKTHYLDLSHVLTQKDVLVHKSVPSPACTYSPYFPSSLTHHVRNRTQANLPIEEAKKDTSIKRMMGYMLAASFHPAHPIPGELWSVYHDTLVRLVQEATLTNPPIVANLQTNSALLTFNQGPNCAAAALLLLGLVENTDWTLLELPDIAVSIGLHCGPIYHGQDRIGKTKNLFGRHLATAAEITQVTTHGCAFVSQHFAGCLLADPELLQSYHLESAGTMQLKRGRERIIDTKKKRREARYRGVKKHAGNQWFALEEDEQHELEEANPEEQVYKTMTLFSLTQTLAQEGSIQKRSFEDDTDADSLASPLASPNASPVKPKRTIDEGAGPGSRRGSLKNGSRRRSLQKSETQNE